MRYQVELTPQARIELYNSALWWAEHRSRDQAARWLVKFETALRQLKQRPERWPFAQENGIIPFEIREMHFGIGRRKTHRAVFRIRDDRVVVYAVRHFAQDSLTADHF